MRFTCQRSLAEESTFYPLLNMLHILGDRPVITLGGNRSDEKGHRGQLVGARRWGGHEIEVGPRLEVARLSPEGVAYAPAREATPPAGARGLGSAATVR